jgi:hypothetical protein
VAATDTPPDVVILGAAWKPRALIRAQLIEEGFEVVATDSWPMMRRHLRPGAKPKAALVDLEDLPNPRDVLRDLRVLMKPDRVLVLTAIGTMSREDVHEFGFRAISRPLTIGGVVRTIADAVARWRPDCVYRMP